MSLVDCEAVVATLERTPSALRAMLTGLPAELVHATEGGESWSPFDIVGHLIHAERTDWIPRLQIILAEGRSDFERFDRRVAGHMGDASAECFHRSEVDVVRDVGLALP
jgi:hypothetical protein